MSVLLCGSGAKMMKNLIFHDGSYLGRFSLAMISFAPGMLQVGSLHNSLIEKLLAPL